jgi:hypothetical protein
MIVGLITRYWPVSRHSWSGRNQQAQSPNNPQDGQRAKNSE